MEQWKVEDVSMENLCPLYIVIVRNANSGSTVRCTHLYVHMCRYVSICVCTYMYVCTTVQKHLRTFHGYIVIISSTKPCGQYTHLLKQQTPIITATAITATTMRITMIIATMIITVLSSEVRESRAK